jgi:hypothetical protein
MSGAVPPTAATTPRNAFPGASQLPYHRQTGSYAEGEQTRLSDLLKQVLVAEAYELVDVVQAGGFLEHEGGYVGSGDCEGFWRQVACDDA